MKNIKTTLFSLCLLVSSGAFAVTDGLSAYGTLNTDITARSLTSEQQASIDRVAELLNQKHLEANPATDAEVKRWMDGMNADGSWDDGKYGQMNAAGRTAPNRLVVMAVAYRHPKSGYYMNEKLLERIVDGCTYFADNHPQETGKRGDPGYNWWYDEIGTPQRFVVPLLLVKGYADQEKLAYCSKKYVRNLVRRFLGEAKNLTWICEIAIYKGCIENDFAVVQEAFDGILSTLAIISEQGEEGIKADASFHQHHEQIYSGGYGMSITNDIAGYMEIAEGTLFYNYTQEKNELFRFMLLQGHRLLGYRGVIDFGTIGRGIARDSEGKRTNIDPAVLRWMAKTDTEHKDEYEAWIDHIENQAPFPLNINKHFWKSDMMTQHGANYYMSAKIISTRTLGVEMINSENKLGYNLPLGATNILTSGKEYNGGDYGHAGAIYGIWDWSRVPGTTAAQNVDSARLGGYLYGTNTFGGGISNEKDGVLAYKHDYRGLKAQKAYFFIDDCMVCLGTGITTDGKSPIATSVNQAFFRAPVTFGLTDGTTNNQTAITPVTRLTSFDNTLSWIHHDNVGYIFPERGLITAGGLLQKGNWNNIGTGNPLTSDQGRVFSAYFEHGTAPQNATYQYIVVPDMSLGDFEAFTKDHGFEIMANTKSAQAVKRGHKYAVVFYEGAEVTMDDLRLSAGGPLMALIVVENGEYQVSVSDPTYRAGRPVSLTLNKKLIGGTELSDGTKIELRMPSGDYTGSTVTNVYQTAGGTGIGKTELNERVTVYPNPVETEVNVSFEAGVFNKIECLSLQGAALQQMPIESVECGKTLSMHGYTPGYYLIRLIGDNTVCVKKVLKQ